MQQGSMLLGAALHTLREESEKRKKAQLAYVNQLYNTAKEKVKTFNIEVVQRQLLMEEHQQNQNAMATLNSRSSTPQLVELSFDATSPENLTHELTRRRDEILSLLDTIRSRGDLRALSLIVHMEIIYAQELAKLPSSAPYDNEYWESRSTVLKAAYNNSQASIEAQCLAKLVRAELLFYRFGDKNADKNFNKAKQLCLELPNIIARIQPVNVNIYEMYERIIILSKNYNFDTELITRLPQIRTGQRMLYNMLLAFKRNDFEATNTLAMQFIKRNKSYEIAQRYWARYLEAVAKYHLLLREQAESKFIFFIQHYACNYAEFDPEGKLRRNACAYLFVLRNPDNENEISMSYDTFSEIEDDSLPERGCTPWHLDFDNALKGAINGMPENAFHPGLGSVEDQDDFSMQAIIDQLNDELLFAFGVSPSNSEHRRRSSTASSGSYSLSSSINSSFHSSSSSSTHHHVQQLLTATAGEKNYAL